MPYPRCIVPRLSFMDGYKLIVMPHLVFLTVSLFMSFHSHLVTVMGLVITWSVTLLVVDAYSLFIKRLPHQRRIIITIVLEDMVCATYD